jgi:hypothetical protein
MRRRDGLGTDRQFAYQARTVAGGALLASIASLGGVGVGMWLLIYSQDFLSLIGVPLRDAFAGYAVFASYMLITGMYGAVVSLKRTAMGLLIFTALLISNLVCQACILSYIFLESKQVMKDMNSTILHTTDCRTFDTIVYKFDCKLERIESSDQCRLDVESDLTDLQACTTSVNDWLTKGVWSTVAVSAILIAFQLLLGITSVMLRHMIMETPNYSDCCLPWQRRRNKTAPTLSHRVTVTPTTEVLSSDPQNLWLGAGPSNQGVVNPIFHTSRNPSSPQGRRTKSGRKMHYNLRHS